MYGLILAAMDRDDEAGTDLIAQRCADLVRLCQARVSLIHVRPRLPDSYSRYLPARWEDHEVEDVRNWLGDTARAHGFERSLHSVHTPAGSVSGEVLAAAAEHAADVILVAAHRMTLGRIILGSNAHAIMRDAPCDVLVARAPAS